MNKHIRIAEFDQMQAELVEWWSNSDDVTRAMLTELVCQLETQADATGRMLSSFAAKFAMLGMASVIVAMEAK